MLGENICDICHKFAPRLKWTGDIWICRHCCEPEETDCRLFEYGHENPLDPKGSTAHVRDIKARRIDPKTKKLFYYQAPKTYFFGG